MRLTLCNKPTTDQMPAVRGPAVCFVLIMIIKEDEIGLRCPWDDRLFFLSANHIHLLLLWLYNPSADTLAEQMCGGLAVCVSANDLTVCMCINLYRLPALC